MGIGRVTDRYRAVFDTNVYLSAALSKSLTSPTRELLAWWEQDQFTLLTCEALAAELIEKLIEHQIEPNSIARLVATLRLLADWVWLPRLSAHAEGQGTAAGATEAGGSQGGARPRLNPHRCMLNFPH